MAQLTIPELVELRQLLAASFDTVTWNKPQINAAAQAVNDWLDSQRVAIGAAIEAAAPGVFTNAQKVKIAKYTLTQRVRLD
jgi:hypothetical protein